MTVAPATTVDEGEIERFSALAESWWDPEGPMKPLHRLTPTRMQYLSAQLCGHFGREAGPASLKGLRILDVGCGAGLVSEPLSRLGADVTGLDAARKNIEAARLHAEAGGLQISYHYGAAEDLAGEGHQYDAVMALEIIEHVADPALFTAAIARLVRPGGLAIFSTINRTPKAWAMTIAGAEYILQWLPKGTHTYDKFVKPSELTRHCRASDLSPSNLTGLIYTPWSGFSLSTSDLDVNYFLSAMKADAE